MTLYIILFYFILLKRSNCGTPVHVLSAYTGFDMAELAFG